MISYPSYRYAQSLALAMGLFGALSTSPAQTIPGKVPINTSPSRVIGQNQLKILSGAPNLVEGRELNTPADVAVDAANRILWVADTGNNRVLGWKNPGNTLISGSTADYVLGQVDKQTTLPGGPSGQFKSGLIAPTSVTVDSGGNVYVADAGNNRIVRYPQPFAQTPGDPVLADFVIGQTSVSSGRDPNSGGRSAKTIFLSSGNSLSNTGMRFDDAGNLWLTDAGNNRVLRYPASVLPSNTSSKPSGPAADLVLGQVDFLQSTLPTDAKSKINLQAPAALTFDQAGRLFVADLQNRVLVYTQPFTTGMSAQRLMGAPKPPAPGQSIPPINEYTVGATTTGGNIPPEGVFTIGNIPFVVDQAANRILRFAPYDQWPLESESFSPAAVAVIGQDSFLQTEPLPNRGLASPGANRFQLPGKAIYFDGKVYVADSGNHRVLVFNDLSTGPATANTEYSATIVLGQNDVGVNGRNLVEGREVSGPNGIAVFTAPDGTPRMFIADTNNNRILGYADARKVKPGDKADIVIGQLDFGRTLINSPYNSQTQRDETSLNQPHAVAVDKDGNLWVADTLNSRVLRFPQPFSPTFNGKADLVLGQTSFTNAATDATSRTMAAPFGLAFTFGGLLAVSDPIQNRVLIFIPPFSNGMAASKVVGQSSFFTTGSGSEDDRLNQPRGIATDTDDRLYVADFNNNRVQIFSRITALGESPTAIATLASSQTQGVAVSKLTGEIWVLEPGGTRRFPKFDTLLGVGNLADYQIVADTAGGQVPNTFLAADFDQFNNLYLAEFANRVTVFYPKMSVCNGATFVVRTLAPGLIATASTGADTGCEGGENLVYTFSDQTVSYADVANPVPLPRTLADVQILINGVPAPLYFVSPFQVNFLIPNSLPPTGTIDIVAYNVKTGRVIGATTSVMGVAAPGIFMKTFERGTKAAPAHRQAAAINEDGTINSVENPAVRGTFVSILGTGAGFMPNAPPDGAAAPSDPLVTSPAHLRVIVGAIIVEPGPDIKFSGLSPNSVGLWEVKVKIPDTTVPGEALVNFNIDDQGANPRSLEFGFNPYIQVK